jgi:hypothetical protein
LERGEDFLNFLLGLVRQVQEAQVWDIRQDLKDKALALAKAGVSLARNLARGRAGVSLRQVLLVQAQLAKAMDSKDPVNLSISQIKAKLKIRVLAKVWFTSIQRQRLLLDL